MNLEVAAHILAKAKRLAPDRFPQPSPETAQVWAEALGSVDFPPQLWSDAVVLWATSLVGERMVTPRDLVQAAHLVRDRWEGDPGKAAMLTEHRVRRANSNYARMGVEPIGAADLPRYAIGPSEARHGPPRRQQTRPERIDVTGIIKEENRA